MQTIYKKDSAGKVRQLSVYTEGADLIYLTGVVDGKLVEARKTCKGKNIGKVNETTPESQALAEAASKIENERSKGYFDTIEEAQGSAVILPMLAKTFKDEAHKIKWEDGVVVQCKLDGCRALGMWINDEVVLISRKGKVMDAVPHINDALASWMPKDAIIDGELFAKGLSFQTNMSLIKRNQPDSVKIQFCIYDTATPSQLSQPYKGRMNYLSAVVPTDNPYCYLLGYSVVTSEDEMKALHAEFVGQGYEGTMVKWGNFPYQINKRSSGMLKYKDWQDIALPIKDIRPSDDRPEQGFPWFHWPGAKNDELSAGMKFDHAFREEFLKNKQDYIGKIAELRFFELSDTGVPRMPTCVGFREDLS